MLRLKVGLSFLAFVLIGANDGATGVLLPSISAHYAVDKATVGLLFLASTAGYLTAAFTSGLALEKLGRRLFLAAGLLAFALGAASISIAPPFALVLVAVGLLGLGVGILDAGLNTHIASLPNNTSLLNYLHAFYGMGALLGPLIASGILAAQLAWNATYIVWLAASLLLLTGFVPLFGDQRPLHEEHIGTGNVLASALRMRAVWMAGLFLLFYVGAEVSLGQWSYTFLTEERHQAALPSGWMVSGYWLGLMVGRFALGRVSRNTSDKRLIQICLAGVIASVLLVWLAPMSAASALGLWLAGFSLGPIYPTTIALMSRLVPARVLPSAIGFTASLGSAGAAFFPWIAGNLAESLGLGALPPYVIALSVIMLLFWLALQRRGSPA